MDEPRLRYLFQPIKIGRMELKNRILMSPMGLTSEVHQESYYPIEPNMKYFYKERAIGGVAAILNGGAATCARGSAEPGTVCMFDDRIIPSLKEVVDWVHDGAPDCKFGVQLLHAGRQARVLHQEAPSPLPSLAVVPTAPGYPEEMTKERIKESIREWGECAMRAKKAGCDFVEIHGAHGYLIGEFYSPLSNHRTDEYGGSFENRIRYYLEVLRAIREQVGPDFPVGCRINGDDFIDGGWTLEEACRLAPILEKEGADYINVSFGIYGSPRKGQSVPSMYDKQGEYIYLAAEIKKHVSSIPVIGGGRVKNPVMADELIRKGKVDMVFMGRALWADSDLPDKAKQGKIDEIRPCLGCCLGCIERAKWGLPETCVMNPRFGREIMPKEMKGECAANPKGILIAGGGPAGLEAARVLAFRGHKPILCESRGWLGGQLKLAAMIPEREEFGDAITYYEKELHRLGVPIHLNTTVDEALIDAVKPDVFIAATGSLPEMPYITGLLESGVEIITADDLIESKLLTGDNVLVIGGDAIGLQVAHYLAVQGKKVYVAESGEHFAIRMGMNDRWPLRLRLADLHVPLRKGVSFPQSVVTANGVKIVHKGGEDALPRVDTVVLADKRTKNAYIAEVAEKKGIETYIVGDAHMLYEDDTAATVMNAIAEAYTVGRQIK